MTIPQPSHRARVYPTKQLGRFFLIIKVGYKPYWAYLLYFLISLISLIGPISLRHSLALSA